jgi:NodT family efflux transporter outer membrane factor (OMF) lipoprotein
MASRRYIGCAVACGVATLAAACTVGPDYHRPAAPVPAHYKEAAGWKQGRPADASPRGPWWSFYKDPVLDGLEKRVDISNQNLKAAEAAFRAAEAVVAQARAGLFPTISANASATRSRAPGGRDAGGGFIANQFQLTGDASWAPDLWGRIRRTVESNVATAQASSGDLESARLSAQGTLASDYLQLRIADALERLLRDATTAYAESLRITRNQYKSGTAAQSDVAQAEAQLRATEAQAIAVANTRAALDHAIAVLIGVPPAELTIAPVRTVPETPAIPVGLPATLLERRPDIAAAERRMAAANAQIGVAVAAFYPDVTLTADYGTAAAMLGNLFTASSRLWSLGSSLAQTVFDAGARNAQVKQAQALYDEDVADYRQTVLTAFQQVEDNLAALRILADQLKSQDQAVAAARQAERIINNQYLAGTVAYTSVVVAEQTALSDAEAALSIRQSRLTASVSLIEALGGGWDSARLPSRDRIQADSPLDFNPFPPRLK